MSKFRDTDKSKNEKNENDEKTNVLYDTWELFLWHSNQKWLTEKMWQLLDVNEKKEMMLIN